MKKLILIALTLMTTLAHAVKVSELRPGDVLLQPLSCWACALIEAEEETIYSHVGVVLAVQPEVVVAEAFSKVRKQTLAEFNAKTERGQKILVIRFRNDRLVRDIEAEAAKFMQIFEEDFMGAYYDAEFRWNNFDQYGREKLYCSELVTKLFQALTGVETPVKRMHFQKNRDAWTTYFRGNVPDGQWGNSPGDFHRSDLFYEVGEL